MSVSTTAAAIEEQRPFFSSERTEPTSGTTASSSSMHVQQVSSLQQAIQRARRRQRRTVRFVVTMGSAALLGGLILYYFALMASFLITERTWLPQRQDVQIVSTAWSAREESPPPPSQQRKDRRRSRRPDYPIMGVAQRNYYPWNSIFSGSSGNVGTDYKPVDGVSDGDDTIDDNGDESSRSSTYSSSSINSKEHPNPSVYGWTPHMYPNPLQDPLRCAIAYILPHLKEQQHQLRMQKIAEQQQQDNDQNATMIEATSEDETESADDEDIPLRLCDPDWVLGGVVLEDVAASMYNFSRVFGDEENWEVGVDEWNDRTRKLTTQQRHQQQTSNSIFVLRRSLQPSEGSFVWDLPAIELGVSIVRKMNLAAVLRQASYYAYEDEEDMTNDAAQTFARSLHESWWSDAATGKADYGILLFLSVQDRVCFISTGAGISSILPWWRLDHIVASMKPDLRHRDYGNALLRAIDDLSHMLWTGPPTLADRFHDFVARFGVVIAFAFFTFVFGAWGEYRDRRKRWQYAEQRSKLSCVDRQKALHLQREFRTRCCPICLETFDYGDTEQQVEENSDPTIGEEKTGEEGDVQLATAKDRLMDRHDSVSSFGAAFRKSPTDEFGIPRRGADGKRIKLLRCGHIFCSTCWTSWVHSGCGNPCNCPVCRQDVGKNSKARSRSSLSSSAPHTGIVPEETQSNNDPPGTTLYGALADGGGEGTTGNPSPINDSRLVHIDTLLGGTVSLRYPSSRRLLARQIGSNANESSSLLGNSRHGGHSDEFGN